MRNQNEEVIHEILLASNEEFFLASLARENIFLASLVREKTFLASLVREKTFLAGQGREENFLASQSREETFLAKPSKRGNFSSKPIQRGNLAGRTSQTGGNLSSNPCQRGNSALEKNPSQQAQPEKKHSSKSCQKRNFLAWLRRKRKQLFSLIANTSKERGLGSNILYMSGSGGEGGWVSPPKIYILRTFRPPVLVGKWLTIPVDQTADR